jgi:hypothetical protein
MLVAQALLKRERLVTLSNGLVLPITGLFDADGDPTDSFDEAVAFTCGAQGVGFFAGALAPLRLETVH